LSIPDAFAEGLDERLGSMAEPRPSREPFDTSSKARSMIVIAETSCAAY